MLAKTVAAGGLGLTTVAFDGGGAGAGGSAGGRGLTEAEGATGDGSALLEATGRRLSDGRIAGVFSAGRSAARALATWLSAGFRRAAA